MIYGKIPPNHSGHKLHTESDKHYLYGSTGLAIFLTLPTRTKSVNPCLMSSRRMRSTATFVVEAMRSRRGSGTPGVMRSCRSNTVFISCTNTDSRKLLPAPNTPDKCKNKHKDKTTNQIHSLSKSKNNNKKVAAKF